MAGIFRFCRLSDEAIIFGSVGHIATHIVENRHKIMCFLTIKQILDIKVSLMGGIFASKNQIFQCEPASRGYLFRLHNPFKDTDMIFMETVVY